MKRFRFRLQRMLDLKEQHERDRARSLGEAQSDEQTRRESLGEATARLDAAAESVRQNTGQVVPAGTLRNFGLTVQAAQEQVERAEREHRAAQDTVETERTRFDEARKDRRVVERLKERREGVWQEEATREEQKEIDQNAAQRWIKEEQP